MNPPSVRVTVRSLMLAVAVVAGFASLPRSPATLLAQSLAVVVLIPSCLAPAGHRTEAAYWATVVHPLLFVVYLHLIWGAAWWAAGHRPLPSDYPTKGVATVWLLDVPYTLSRLSLLYLPALGILSLAFSQVHPLGPSVSRPMKVLPGAWLATLIVVTWDPFDILPWFWD